MLTPVVVLVSIAGLLAVPAAAGSYGSPAAAPAAARASGNPAAAPVAARLSVTGYASVTTTSTKTLNLQAPGISTVGLDGLDVTASGAAVSAPTASALALEAQAHRDRLRAELLVSNYDTAAGTFSPAIAAKLLGSSSNRSTVAAALARTIVSHGFDGITVDLESLSAADAGGLVSFLGALRHDLPAKKTVSVDVSAATTLSGYVSQGYDLKAIGAVVNDVVLMAYDEHGPWSTPGPIGGLPWQKESLAVLLTQVPADKVQLGVAGYGYTWPAGSAVHQGASVSDAQARKLVASSGATAQWSTTQGEWTATLPNGTVLWWSDVRSYLLRQSIARADHLAGLAIWQLSSIDQLPSNNLRGA